MSPRFRCSRVLTLLAAATVVAIAGAGGPSGPSGSDFAPPAQPDQGDKPPKPPTGPIMWSRPLNPGEDVWTYFGGTWDQIKLKAAAYVEEIDGVVYDDWRLPTVAELQAAVSDSDPDTFGQFYNPGFPARHISWTSQAQGTWVKVVEWYDDGSGAPDPTTSGLVDRTLKGSMLHTKFVRP